MQALRFKQIIFKGMFLVLLPFVSSQVTAQIACSSSVQVSMDEHCQAILKPEVFLQGFYDSFDFFELTIEGVMGNVVTEPGNYSITVTDTRSDNSCWGTAIIENKIPPNLNCKELIIPCYFDPKPGSNIIKNYRGVGVIGNHRPGYLDVDVLFRPIIPQYSYIEDIKIELHQLNENFSHVSVYVVSPAGSKIQLFHSFESSKPDCVKEEMVVHFGDHYDKPNNELIECDPGPSIIGQYKPYDSFNTLKGEPAWGSWSIHVEDSHGKPIQNWFKEAIIHVSASSVYYGLPFDDGQMQFEVLSDRSLSVWGGDLCGPVVLSYSDEKENGCTNNGYSGMMMRNWQIADGVGNVNWCQQPIYFESSSYDNLVMPHDYDDLAYPSFHCSYDWTGHLDEFGQPSPSLTGFPIDSRLYREQHCGNMEVSYKDAILPVCEGSYKIIRTWTMINWCKNAPFNVEEHNQIITISDKNGPAISCPDKTDLIVNVSSPHDCGKNILVPHPTIKQGCGTYDWTVKYAIVSDSRCDEPTSNLYTSEGVQKLDGDVYINSLQSGCIWIKYIVNDGCGHSNEYACKMNLKDTQAPVAVCDNTTVVSLSNNGTASLPASTFDDFSTDNCSPVFFKGRKLVNVCDTIYEPREYIEFCCAEAGQTVMLEIFVFDQSGNKSSCHVEAKVQDKLDAFLKCPDDVKVTCHTRINELTDALYGWPKAEDNCASVGELKVEYVDSLDQCGVGVVLKSWSLLNDVPFSVQKICTQRFTYEFVRSDIEHQIYFPADTVLAGCSRDVALEETGEPEIIKEGCSLIAVNHKDSVFDIADDACEKILREWTVIDWCQYKPERGITAGFWQEVQVIKFLNTTKPQIVSSCEPLEVCTRTTDCSGEIELVMSAIDDCTNSRSLTWEYTVDLYSDMRTELRETSLSSEEDSVTVIIKDLPLDVTHLITWRVHDGCLNYSQCKQELTVKDCTPPTPFCLGGAITTFIDQSGTAQIWARDFDLKSEDNCSKNDELRFSFSEDPTDSNRYFNCDDIPNGKFNSFDLQVFVTDPSGNQESCHVLLELQDNDSACSDDNVGSSLMMDVEGTIQTEINSPINGVEVTIESSQPGFPKYAVTGQDGQFIFPSVPMDQNYSLTSFKNDNLLNGVTTLDLVNIQRHIIGIEPFTNPYSIIAADIDNNGELNVSDLVELRRVVLGFENQFPNGQLAWRFVDPARPILDESNPFPFIESIQISGTQNLQRAYAFMGIKIGDVNRSVQMSAQQQLSETRNHDDVKFVITNSEVEEGETIDIEFRLAEDADVFGFQYAFQFDPLALNVISIDGGNDIDLTESDRRITANEIKFSWTKEYGKILKSGDLVFAIKARVHRTGEIQDYLSFNNELNFNSEWYPNTNDVLTINSRFNESDESEFVLHQNHPNPFSHSTQINIELPEKSQVSLNLINVSGSVIYESSSTYQAGVQTIDLLKDAIGNSGIYYYTVTVNGVSKTKKLVVL